MAGAPAKAGAPASLAFAVAAAALLANGLAGRRFSPSPDHPATRSWYRRLRKPGFTPPDSAFAPVWIAIELGLAHGGYRLMRRGRSPARDAALCLWGVNMAAIGGWSALFFGGKALGASALASAGMICTAAGYIAAAAGVDRRAAATGLPFLAWLGFATVLAEETWRRNRRETGADTRI